MGNPIFKRALQNMTPLLFYDLYPRPSGKWPLFLGRDSKSPEGGQRRPYKLTPSKVSRIHWPILDEFVLLIFGGWGGAFGGAIGFGQGPSTERNPPGNHANRRKERTQPRHMMAKEAKQTRLLEDAGDIQSPEVSS